ncbi:MAG: dephospho-CoA kinase [Cellulosilyticaceae bacterium]
MKVIGVVGGIGAGKTTVVSILSTLKEAYIIGADEIGHQLLLKEGKAYERVIQTFGESILDEDKNIIRARLGEIVFSDKEKLNELNKISHALIFEEVKHQIEACKIGKLYEWVIIDAALLIEIGLIRLTDEVVGVYAEEETRIQRIMERNNLSREEALKRIKSQKKWEEFKKVSSSIIDNSFSYEQTKDQIQQLIASW